MPLQNRVTPFGEILALPGRGLFTGNRGILHDDARRLVRTSQVRRWITCRLEYRGIRRTPMTPHTWTELFFLDEAVAFAAGHRPCAECRRDDYRRFRHAWDGLRGALSTANSIDAELQASRRKRGTQLVHRDEFALLPDGTFVLYESGAWLIRGSSMLEWSDGGYVGCAPRPRSGNAVVLTPAPLVDVLRAGYEPVVHPSARLYGGQTAAGVLR